MTTNKIQKAAQNGVANGDHKGLTIRDYVKSMQPAIEKAVPRVITSERFTRIIMTALSSDPKLQQTAPQSFVGAMMTAAQLGLEPNTPLGQAYLIPFRNKGKLECQFQIGYKGLIDLAYRSGEVKTIQAHVVYENDGFEFEYGLEPKLEHHPCMAADKGNPVWIYALFITKDGGNGFEVMSVADVRAHAKKYSQSYASSYSPWKTNFEAMAKKTVLKQVLKYAPLKTEFARALSLDETIKSDLSDDMASVPNEVEFTTVEEEMPEKAVNADE